MADPLRIEYISDVACPWCMIGLGGLLTAMVALKDEVPFDLRFLPFELNPDVGPKGENAAEHAARKHGATPESLATEREKIRERGAVYGFVFNYSAGTRIWNTFDAHRLVHAAASEGRQLQLMQALFKANFTDQRSLSDRATLLDAWRAAGLDSKRAVSVLESGQFADDVRGTEAHWKTTGLEDVPTAIFAQRWVVQGAHGPETYAQVIRDVISGKATKV